MSLCLPGAFAEVNVSVLFINLCSACRSFLSNNFMGYSFKNLTSSFNRPRITTVPHERFFYPNDGN